MTFEEFPDGTKRVKINGVEIIIGMPIDEYHRMAAPGEIDYFSKTRLHNIIQNDKGPEWVWQNYEKGRFPVKDQDDRDVGDGRESHYVVGRAIDTLLFDGEAEYKRIYKLPPETYPSEIKATKANNFMGGTELKKWTYKANFCQEWRDQQEAAGYTVMEDAQAKWVAKAYLSLHRHQGIHAILEDEDWISQVTFRWQDESGRWLQARPDLVNLRWNRWGDLKTTRYWHPEAYGREFFNRGYHLQAYLIDNALTRIHGEKPNERKHLVCGKQEFPQTRIENLVQAHIDAGEMSFRRCLEVYTRCEKSGQWWEVQEQESFLSVPNFIQFMLSNKRDPARAEIYDFRELSADIA